jgi:hypothetical protein
LHHIGSAGRVYAHGACSVTIFSRKPKISLRPLHTKRYCLDRTYIGLNRTGIMLTTSKGCVNAYFARVVTTASRHERHFSDVLNTSVDHLIADMTARAMATGSCIV